LFLTQGLGYAAYLTRDGATLVFSESSKSADGRTTRTEKVVRLNIVGILSPKFENSVHSLNQKR